MATPSGWFEVTTSQRRLTLLGGNFVAGKHPDVLDDEPSCRLLPLEGRSGSRLGSVDLARPSGHQRFVVISAIVRQVTGVLRSHAAQGDVASDGVHDVFEETSDCGL